MRHFLLLGFSILLVFLSSVTWGEEAKVYSCHRLIKEPILDGKIRDDLVWENIPWEGDFVKLGTDSFASKQTLFKTGYTGKALYIGIGCLEPEVKQLKLKLNGGPLFEEDSVEIFIFPKGAENYFQFVVNAIGSRWNGIGWGRQQPLWNWQAKGHKGENFYFVEVKIPFEILKTIPKGKEKWRINFCRNIVSTFGDRYTSWAYMVDSFHEPNNFGTIIFEDSILTEEIANLEERLSIIYREEVKEEMEKIEKFIISWEKEYPSDKEKISPYIRKWNEIKGELANLDSVPLKDLQKLLAELKSRLFYLKEAKGEFLRNRLFEEN